MLLFPSATAAKNLPLEEMATPCQSSTLATGDSPLPNVNDRYRKLPGVATMRLDPSLEQAALDRASGSTASLFQEMLHDGW